MATLRTGRDPEPLLHGHLVDLQHSPGPGGIHCNRFLHEDVDAGIDCGLVVDGPECRRCHQQHRGGFELQYALVAFESLKTVFRGNPVLRSDLDRLFFEHICGGHDFNLDPQGFGGSQMVGQGSTATPTTSDQGYLHGIRTLRMHGRNRERAQGGSGGDGRFDEVSASQTGI